MNKTRSKDLEKLGIKMQTLKTEKIQTLKTEKNTDKQYTKQN